MRVLVSLEEFPVLEIYNIFVFLFVAMDSGSVFLGI